MSSSNASAPVTALADEASPVDWKVVGGLAVLSIALRLVLALLPCNEAEYTDGILQLTLFSKGNPYWPPLYSALSVALGSLLGDLEKGGRVVSAVLGGLAIVPLMLIAHRMAGHRAANFAGLIFIVLPEPMRWGIRVMTDATFLTLFAFSVYLLMPPNERGWLDPRRLALASLCAVLASLTRYQGMILLLPIAYALIQGFYRRQKMWLPLLAQGLWLAVPAWMLREGFAHAQQFSDRSGSELGLTKLDTLLAYWNLAESYIYLFPYSVTFGVFGVFLAGVFSPVNAQKLPGRWLLGMLILTGMALMAAQAAFGIFEFRYMMPLLVFIVPYTGVGLLRIDEALHQWRMPALAVFCLVLVPPMLLNMGSLVLQRETFGDIKAAAQYAGELTAAESRIFTNEFYNAKMPVVKASFYAGRKVLPDPVFRRFLQYSFAPDSDLPTLAPEERLQVGDVILFCTLYAGPPPNEIHYLSYLG